MAKSAPQKIGLFGLIGMVISSCIGSGVYALTGQLAKVASPGAIIVAWVIAGVGFLALALSLANLSAKKPVIKVGAEIPFTRYFYKYRKPTPSEELEQKFLALEESVTARVKTLFSEE